MGHGSGGSSGSGGKDPLVAVRAVILCPAQSTALWGCLEMPHGIQVGWRVGCVWDSVWDSVWDVCRMLDAV